MMCKKFSILRTVALLAALGALMPGLGYARDVSFVWNANPEPVTGYKLYYKTGTDAAAPFKGTGLAEGAAPIVLGNVTTCTVTGLLPEETYQFVLTAYNETEESPYSAVVSVAPGGAPKIIKMTLKR